MRPGDGVTVSFFTYTAASSVPITFLYINRVKPHKITINNKHATSQNSLGTNAVTAPGMMTANITSMLIPTDALCLTTSVSLSHENFGNFIFRKSPQTAEKTIYTSGKSKNHSFVTIPALTKNSKMTSESR